MVEELMVGWMAKKVTGLALHRRDKEQKFGHGQLLNFGELDFLCLWWQKKHFEAFKSKMVFLYKIS